MNEINVFKKATMSSLEIAELTGKQHKNVMADIRKILDEVGISSAEFSAVYKDQQLIERPCYKLPRRECDLIIAGYSAKLNGSYSATNLTSFLAPPGQKRSDGVTFQFCCLRHPATQLNVRFSAIKRENPVSINHYGGYHLNSRKSKHPHSVRRYQ